MRDLQQLSSFIKNFHFMKSRKYQNSLCGRGTWLHKFKILGSPKGGILERCERCGVTKFFSENVPNHIYLSWHIRSGLQVTDYLFNREYPHASR